MSVRVNARLDIIDPNLVKGIYFEGLRVLGKPERFAQVTIMKESTNFRSKPSENRMGSMRPTQTMGESVPAQMPLNGRDVQQNLAPVSY